MQFQPGNNANPNGRPRGYQDFIVRAKTVLFDKDQADLERIVNDKKEFGKLPVIDAMIYKRAALATGDQAGSHMDNLLDRVLGKPMQQLQIESNQNVNVNVVIEDRRKEALSELERFVNVIEHEPAKVAIAHAIVDNVSSGGVDK